MHSSVLTGTVSVPGHMSASGSRGIIHIHSSVVTVARPTRNLWPAPPASVLFEMARPVCINVSGLGAERPAKMEIRAFGS
jgi:hypothetical protein